MKLSVCVIIVTCLLLKPSTAFAAESQLVIAPQTATQHTPASRLSASTTTAATATETSTAFYSFNHYPENWPYSPTPWSGAYMEGVGLRTDRFLTIWYAVYGVWSYDIEETWEATFLKPDGTVFDGFRWHTAMETVNGVLEKCYSSYHLPSGTLSGKFCADDPTYGKQTGISTIYFGTTRNPWNDQIEVDSIRVTHNGTGLHAEPYLLSDVGIINPNPGLGLPLLIDASGELIFDPTAIAAKRSSYRPLYAATDGVTPLFVKAASVTGIPVTLRIASASTDDGTLTSLDGSQGPTSTTPDLQQTTSGEDYALGIYWVPPEIGTAAASRQIQIQMSFALPWRTEPTVLFGNLTLIRPPLLLVHGMWSDDSAWQALMASPFISAIRPTRKVDWYPADTPLLNNVNLVANNVISVLSSLRNQRVALTQMDVIAHSAGGPLFRLYAQQPNYRRPNNFMFGDFRKMLTLGSPHHGTPIANFVQALLTSANPTLVNWVKSGFAKNGRNITRGIIGDLQTTSSTMTGIQQTPGLAHAWIGDLPSLSASEDEKKLWDLLAFICSTNDAQSLAPCAGIRTFDVELLRSRVFSFQLNDGLVAHDMQTGGVAIWAQTILSNTPHTQETQTVSPAEVAALLDGTGGALDDGGFR